MPKFAKLTRMIWERSPGARVAWQRCFKYRLFVTKILDSTHGLFHHLTVDMIHKMADLESAPCLPLQTWLAAVKEGERVKR
jgi:hypothetical protein